MLSRGAHLTHRQLLGTAHGFAAAIRHVSAFLLNLKFLPAVFAFIDRHVGLLNGYVEISLGDAEDPVKLYPPFG
jgi:hypothetical protein